MVSFDAIKKEMGLEPKTRKRIEVEDSIRLRVSKFPITLISGLKTAI